MPRRGGSTQWSRVADDSEWKLRVVRAPSIRSLSLIPLLRTIVNSYAAALYQRENGAWDDGSVGYSVEQLLRLSLQRAYVPSGDQILAAPEVSSVLGPLLDQEPLEQRGGIALDVLAGLHDELESIEEQEAELRSDETNRLRSGEQRALIACRLLLVERMPSADEVQAARAYAQPIPREIPLTALLKLKGWSGKDHSNLIKRAPSRLEIAAAFVEQLNKFVKSTAMAPAGGVLIDAGTAGGVNTELSRPEVEDDPVSNRDHSEDSPSRGGAPRGHSGSSPLGVVSDFFRAWPRESTYSTGQLTGAALQDRLEEKRLRIEYRARNLTHAQYSRAMDEIKARRRRREIGD